MKAFQSKNESTHTDKIPTTPPFKSQWWLLFVAMATFILVITIINENGRDIDTLEASKAFFTEEKNELIYVRDNEQGEAVSLREGVYTVGVDISPGRYELMAETSKDNFGTIFIADTYRVVVNEAVDSAGIYGVSQITLDLTQGQTIEIDDVDFIHFTPAATTLKTTLHTGTWYVGLDIEPGKYTAFGKGLGNLFVYDEHILIENEILTDREKELSLHIGKASISLTLEKGQRIDIKQLHEISFIKEK